MLEFFVPGEPHGKGRPRVSTRGGFSRMYTPAKTQAYEALVADAASEAMGEREPFDGPLAVSLEVTHGIPQSWSKKKREASVGQPVTAKPDIDNLIKSVADGANGVAWVDDKLIVRVSAWKVYGETPGVRVWVEAA